MFKKFTAIVVLISLCLSFSSSVFAACDPCYGNETVATSMKNAAKQMDEDINAITEKTMGEPAWASLDACLAALDAFDLSKSVNFSFAGILDAIMGAAKKMVIAACKLLVKEMNSKMKEIAGMTEFAYDGPLNLVGGSIGIGTGKEASGFDLTVKRADKSSEYLQKRLTHTSEDIIGSYIKGGSSRDAGDVIKGFTGF